MPNDDATPIRPEPLVISRLFAAPRALVFEAWSTAEHMKRWFSPEHYTVPAAEVDFRAGGICAICMRAPDGQEFWSRGRYVEIVPPERLVFTISMEADGAVRFTARTNVTFAQQGGGTLLSVRQDYEIFDPAFMASVSGAPEGWRTTLDKLAAEIGRLAAAAPATHASFRLERSYAASPAQVFHAFTDPDAKARWFGGGDGCTLVERAMDVRPGGREHAVGRWSSGIVSAFDAFYFDVVADRRLVYAYEMHLNGLKISVSLATIELAAAERGTHLVVTEQGTFLGGYEDAGSREQGTGFLLDRLGASLGR